MRRSKSDYVIQTVTNALRLWRNSGDDERARRHGAVPAAEPAQEQRVPPARDARRDGLRRAGAARTSATGSACAASSSARPSSAHAHADCGSRAPCSRRSRGARARRAHLAVLRGFEVVHLDGEQREPARADAACASATPARALHARSARCCSPAGTRRSRERFDREVVRRRRARGRARDATHRRPRQVLRAPARRRRAGLRARHRGMRARPLLRRRAGARRERSRSSPRSRSRRRRSACGDDATARAARAGGDARRAATSRAGLGRGSPSGRR